MNLRGLQPATASTPIQSRSWGRSLSPLGGRRLLSRQPNTVRGSAAMISQVKEERKSTANSYRSRGSPGGLHESMQASPEDREAETAAEQTPEPVG